MNLCVKDVARVFNVSEKTVYRWIERGTVPVYRVGDQYRFHRAELLEWATTRKKKVSAEIFFEAEHAAASMPSVLDALKAGGISYRVGGRTKAEVLRRVVDALRLPEEVDREFLYQVLWARENLGSTGIGDGLAIPHFRNPVVLHLPRAMITLCFLEEPVDFGALDGKPVDTLLTLVSPSVRSHLHVLSRLGFLLRNTPLKEALRRQPGREELFEAVRLAEATLPDICPAKG